MNQVVQPYVDPDATPVGPSSTRVNIKERPERSAPTVEIKFPIRS